MSLFRDFLNGPTTEEHEIAVSVLQRQLADERARRNGAEDLVGCLALMLLVVTPLVLGIVAFVATG